MINPDQMSVDVETERAWLMSHKAATGMSWAAIAKRSDIPQGTISLFASGAYAGKKENVARLVFKYRQLIESQFEHASRMTAAPTFVETPTSRRIRGLLVAAQGGKITMAATAPGLGKTLTMNEYRDSISNVWCVTAAPSCNSLAAFIALVLKAVGGSSKQGWVRQMSDEVIQMVIGKNGLLIVDEAGHLDGPCLEQLRYWNDISEVGICLLGNSELYMRVRGGAKHDAFGRLNSRIFQSHIKRVPDEEDIAVYLDAWGIMQPELRDPLFRIGRTPSAGGLREICQIIEIAGMLAEDDGVELRLSHLRDAISTRASGDLQVMS